MYDEVSPTHRLSVIFHEYLHVAQIKKAYDNNKKRGQAESATIDAAIEILRKWDKEVSTDSVAMTIAHHYGMQFGQDGSNPKNLSHAELIDYFGTGSPESERLSVFRTTLSNLEEDFGDWKIPWGQVNRFQRLTGDIQQPHDDDAPSKAVGMASSRWGALASFGAKRYPGTKKIYGTAGNRFVAVVEFAPGVAGDS